MIGGISENTKAAGALLEKSGDYIGFGHWENGYSGGWLSVIRIESPDEVSQIEGDINYDWLVRKDGTVVEEVLRLHHEAAKQKEASRLRFEIDALDAANNGRRVFLTSQEERQHGFVLLETTFSNSIKEVVWRRNCCNKMEGGTEDWNEFTVVLLSGEVIDVDPFYISINEAIRRTGAQSGEKRMLAARKWQPFEEERKRKSHAEEMGALIIRACP